MRGIRYSIIFFAIFFIGNAILAPIAQASDGIKLKNGTCTLSDVVQLLQSSRFEGYAACEGVGHPSVEESQCINKLGNGNFENGVAVLKNRQKYNRWTIAVQLAMNPKIMNKSFACNVIVESINSWSGDQKMELIYQDRDYARKLVINSKVLNLE